MFIVLNQNWKLCDGVYFLVYYTFLTGRGDCICSVRKTCRPLIYRKWNPCSLLAAPVRITGTVPDANVTVQENNTISLVCNVEGSPAPTATWSKVGGESAASYLQDREKTLVCNSFQLAFPELLFASVSKRVQVWNHEPFIQKNGPPTGSFSCKSNWLPQERICRKTRFEAEVQDKSEMAETKIITLVSHRGLGPIKTPSKYLFFEARWVSVEPITICAWSYYWLDGKVAQFFRPIGLRKKPKTKANTNYYR